jgi:predicted AAA+ superfamily ATPase
MQFSRTKAIESLKELLSSTESQYIAITGPKGIGKTSFLSLLKENEVFSDDTTEWIFLDQWANIEDYELVNSTPSYIIFDSDVWVKIDDIRTFIVSHLLDSRVIFTNESTIHESDITSFPLPGISFRDYSEANEYPINVGEIMSGNADIDILNQLKDAYIHTGQYPINIDDPENIQATFDDKMTVMVQELFKKEENDFLEFVRTIAMSTGDLFKEERIAKLMNISRRKVRKYTEIILKHNLVHAIGPFVENTETELSRHVKLYFNDLSYMQVALGVAYYQGMTKQWVLENFLLLELERKLAKTHDIRFYRKKSGAEMQFLLIDKTSGKITPIEVRTGANIAISQAMKSWDESYHDRVEHYMILNESEATQKDLNGKNVIILPHVAI